MCSFLGFGGVVKHQVVFKGRYSLLLGGCFSFVGRVLFFCWAGAFLLLGLCELSTDLRVPRAFEGEMRRVSPNVGLVWENSSRVDGTRENTR